MPKTEEIILADRISQGDESAFSLVFTRYYTDLVIFAVTFVRDRSVAEEITQDVFIRLWENRQIFCITLSLKSFLLKAVQNKCIDWIRHRKIRNNYQRTILEHPLLFENDTENYVLYSELKNNLEKALKQLPEEISQVFVLHRFEGKTYPEISEKLSISVRTVEVRISKALTLLKELLRDYFAILIIWFGN